MHKALALIALAVLPAHSALAEEEWNDPRPGDVMIEQPDGAINSRTGEYFPAAGPSGVIDTETGAFYPKAGPSGFIDPQTGEYFPAQ